MKSWTGAAQDALTPERGDPARAPDHLATVRDTVALRDLVVSLMWAKDAKDWDRLALHYLEDGEIALPFDAKPGHVGRDGLGEFVAAAQNHFSLTQHRVSNIRVRIDGDRAVVDTYLQAVHVRRGDQHDHWDAGGRYRFECRRVDGAWGIARSTLWIDSQTGSADFLPADATRD